MKYEQACSLAIQSGCVEIQSGVHLSSKENIMADQDDWLVEGCEVHDFTKAPFWITTNDGQVFPISNESDYLSLIG